MSFVGQWFLGGPLGVQEKVFVLLVYRILPDNYYGIISFISCFSMTVMKFKTLVHICCTFLNLNFLVYFFLHLSKLIAFAFISSHLNYYNSYWPLCLLSLILILTSHCYEMIFTKHKCNDLKYKNDHSHISNLSVISFRVTSKCFGWHAKIFLETKLSKHAYIMLKFVVLQKRW